MTEKIKKHPLNVAGRYYVDCEACLDHDVCVEDAPNNFKKDDEYIAYVFKQPSNPKEEMQCRQALEECPMAAIRDDG
jgi:ferredoxin